MPLCWSCIRRADPALQVCIMGVLFPCYLFSQYNKHVEYMNAHMCLPTQHPEMVATLEALVGVYVAQGCLVIVWCNACCCNFASEVSIQWSKS